jgi:hypothetical protein
LAAASRAPRVAGRARLGALGSLADAASCEVDIVLVIGTFVCAARAWALVLGEVRRRPRHGDLVVAGLDPHERRARFSTNWLSATSTSVTVPPTRAETVFTWPSIWASSVDTRTAK